MRILHWSEFYPPYLGGIERQSQILVEELAVMGHDVLVLSGHGSMDLPDEHLAAPGVPGRRTALRNALAARDIEAMAAAKRQLHRWVADFAPDVIVKRDLHVLATALDGVVRAAGTDPGVVVGVDFSPDAVAGGPGAVHHRTLERADVVLACSTALAEQVVETVPSVRDRVEVVPYGVPAAQGAAGPLPFAPAHPFVFCAPARLLHLKGLDLAVAALGVLRARGHDVRFDIGGEGEAEPDLRRQVEELGLGDVVTFHGWVAPHEVPEFLAAAHVVLMPSRHEAFGLVAVEAALVGRPVVASDVGGLRDIVVDGQTGLQVASDDLTSLIAAMERLVTEVDLAQRLGAEAHRRAQSTYALRPIAERHLAAYRRAIQRRRGE